MKKLLSIVLALAMLLSLAACAKKEETTTPETTEPEQKVYKIGVCQLVQHVALDAATQGFQDALIDAIGADNLDFDIQNASGDATTCSTITNGFVSAKVDLIMANATAALQAAASATDTIPILGTSITDYATALEIDNWNGTVGGNISGTSDLAPLSEQAKMIQEWFPNAQNVGLLYCSAEANSEYQITVMEEELKNLGIQSERFSFTDSNDLSGVVQNACTKCDVIYIPTDNTAANNTETIANIVIPAGVPVIAGEEGICKGCGVATLSISYYDLGFATGEMAAKILTGESDISEMPIEYAPNVTKEVNMDNVNALGLTVPASSVYVVIE